MKVLYLSPLIFFSLSLAYVLIGRALSTFITFWSVSVVIFLDFSYFLFLVVWFPAGAVIDLGPKLIVANLLLK